MTQAAPEEGGLPLCRSDEESWHAGCLTLKVQSLLTDAISFELTCPEKEVAAQEKPVAPNLRGTFASDSVSQ